EITAAGASTASARWATPGGGSTPTRTTSAPSLHNPATSAASSNGPERRVSRPTTNGWSAPITRAAAPPSAVTTSGVRSRLATPRIPSVPNRSVMQPRCYALPLRVLRRLAGLLEPVLATLLLAGVAREQARFLERRAQLVVEGGERAGDAESQ